MAAATPTQRPGQQQRAGIYSASEAPPSQAVPSQLGATPAEDQLIDAMLSKVVIQLDKTASRYAEAVADPARNRLERALMMAEGIERLRKQLSGDVMKRLMALMNSPLGFKTDRPNKSNNSPYSEAEVRDAIVTGLLNGVYPLFNELNIIAGQAYITKEGFQRKLRELPGLTDLVLRPGIPRFDKESGQTVVRFGASWRYNGSAGQLEDAKGEPGIPIAVPVHQGTGPDAIVGKATRKVLKRIYEQLTNSIQSDQEDAEVIEVGEQTVRAPGAAQPPAAKAEETAVKLAEGELSPAELVQDTASRG